MTLSETEIREQIKRAVAEARRRAYERASSMEEGVGRPILVERMY
jgi:hypothetical protein